MSSNRPPSKSGLFKLKHLSNLDTNLKNSNNEQNDGKDSSDKDLALLLKSVNESATPSIHLLQNYFVNLSPTKRAIEAIEILQDLSGLSNSYDNSRDKLVVTKIIDHVMTYVPPDLAENFKTNGRLPSRHISNILVLPKLIPDYLNSIKFHYIEEKKELPNASPPPTISRR